MHRPAPDVARTWISRLDRGALTLLEIVLVLALMCVLGSLAYVTVLRPMASQRLDAAADQLRGEWLRARNRAMSRGVTYAFRCSQESGVYTLEPYEDSSNSGTLTADFGGSNLSGAATASTIQGELPEKIVVHSANVLMDELSAADFADSGLPPDVAGSEGQWTILFYPDGTAVSAVVTLRNEFGRAVDVSLRGLTGAVLVGDAYHVDAAASVSNRQAAPQIDSGGLP